MDSLKKLVEQDLGLGNKVIETNQTRFVNRDGTFNIHRKGFNEKGSFSPYHAILGMSWIRFYFFLLGIFLNVNVLFTILYYLSGKNTFPEIANLSLGPKLLQLYFYSIQIITTLGASPMHPVATMGNIVLSIEVIIGIWSVAISTGLIFARFSNPASKIIFSEYAVIAPYKDIKGFMFRIINGRTNELIEVSATITLSMIDKSGKRSFQQLPLERDTVFSFPLHWTIVHPITPQSPVYGFSETDLEKMKAEFLITIIATDKDLSKRVYARFSYLYNEIIMNARFAPIIEQTPDGTVLADPKNIHLIEKL